MCPGKTCQVGTGDRSLTWSQPAPPGQGGLGKPSGRDFTRGAGAESEEQHLLVFIPQVSCRE